MTERTEKEVRVQITGVSSMESLRASYRSREQTARLLASLESEGGKQKWFVIVDSLQEEEGDKTTHVCFSGTLKSGRLELDGLFVAGEFELPAGKGWLEHKYVEPIPAPLYYKRD